MDITDAIRGFFEDYGIPLALGGQAASVMMRRAAEKKAVEQRNALAEQEMARQAAIAAQSRDRFQQVVPQVSADNFEARRQAEQDKIRGIVAPPTEASAITQNYQQARVGDPQVVGNNIAAAVGRALTRGQDQATNAAIARSFGAAQAGDQVALGRASADIGRLSRDAQRSADILPLELYEANMRSARAPMRTLSDAFGAAADIAGNVALRKRRPAQPQDAWWGTTERNF